MTDAVAARNSKLYVSADDVTYRQVAEMKDDSISVEGETIDVSNKDGSGWKEFIAGLSSAALSGESNYIDDDQAQDMVLSAVESKTALYWRYRPIEGSGKREWTGLLGIPTQWEAGGDVGSAVGLSIEVQFTGDASSAFQA